MTDKERMEAENPYGEGTAHPQDCEWARQEAWNEGYQKCLDTVVAKLRAENVELRKKVTTLLNKVSAMMPDSSFKDFVIGTQVNNQRSQIEALTSENTELREALVEAANYCQTYSSGPAVPDPLWNLRSNLLDALDQSLTTEPEECVWERKEMTLGGVNFPMVTSPCFNRTEWVLYTVIPEKCPHCHKPVRIAE